MQAHVTYTSCTRRYYRVMLSCAIKNSTEIWSQSIASKATAWFDSGTA
jgi:hypothetical protein